MGLAQQCGNKMETILENETANPTLELRDFFCHTTEQLTYVFIIQEMHIFRRPLNNKSNGFPFYL